MNIHAVIAHAPECRGNVPYLEIQYFNAGTVQSVCLYEQDWDDSCRAAYCYLHEPMRQAKYSVKKRVGIIVEARLSGVNKQEHK